MHSSATTRRHHVAGAAAGVILAGSLVAVATGGAASSPAAAPPPGAAVSTRGIAQLRAVPAIRLGAPVSVSAGAHVRLTGKVVVRTRQGVVKRRVVSLVERRSGRWRVIAKDRTTRTGVFVFRIAAGRSANTRTFRVEAAPVHGFPLVRTGAVLVKVRAGTSSATRAAPRVGDLIKPEQLPAGYVGPGLASAWSYLQDGGGRWNPCAVIRWSYNPAGQDYAGALADVARAFAKIAGVSGLRFQYVGPTGYRYLGRRSAHAFPSAKTDMVVAWASQSEMAELAGLTVGIGGGSAVMAPPGADVRYQMTQGYLTLDRSNRVPLAPGFNSSGWGQVMMHEILHALGLGHTAGHPDQLMYAQASSRNYRFGAGDIRGMKKIGVAPGSSGCLKEAP